MSNQIMPPEETTSVVAVYTKTLRALSRGERPRVQDLPPGVTPLFNYLLVTDKSYGRRHAHLYRAMGLPHKIGSESGVGVAWLLTKTVTEVAQSISGEGMSEEARVDMVYRRLEGAYEVAAGLYNILEPRGQICPFPAEALAVAALDLPE